MATSSDNQTALVTIADYIRYGASRFAGAGLCFGHGNENAVDEARILVFHALHLEPPIEPEFMTAALTLEERQRILALFDRRVAERIPAAYLTGEAWFAGLRFVVDPRVLIPRSPLAELIDTGFAPWANPDAVASVLDLCTGSGCIAIACAHAFPDAQVDACDVSADALEVAQINRAAHGLDQRLGLYCSDLFDQLPVCKYDLIVSNPPYVPAAEIAGLPPEFLHEPALGLEAGARGLDIVGRILAQAADWLSDRGVLVLEVGATWHEIAATWPALEPVWVDLEHGGEGVFVLDSQALKQAADSLRGPGSRHEGAYGG